MGSAAHGPRRGERREANDPGPAYGRRGEIRRTPTSGCGWPEASSIHGGGSKATSADAMSAWVGPLRWVRAGGDGGSRIGGCRCWSCGPLWWVVVTGDGGCRRVWTRVFPQGARYRTRGTEPAPHTGTEPTSMAFGPSSGNPERVEELSMAPSGFSRVLGRSAAPRGLGPVR